jgi:hypothetical protein
MYRSQVPRYPDGEGGRAKQVFICDQSVREARGSIWSSAKAKGQQMNHADNMDWVAVVMSICDKFQYSVVIRGQQKKQKKKTSQSGLSLNPFCCSLFFSSLILHPPPLILDKRTVRDRDNDKGDWAHWQFPPATLKPERQTKLTMVVGLMRGVMI